MKFYSLTLTFLFLFILSNAATIEDGEYLFPTNKNLQWAVSYLGKPLDATLEKKIAKYPKFERKNAYCSNLNKRAYDNFKIWEASNCSGPDMVFYFKDNILVKIEAETSYTDAPYVYKSGDYLSFIEKETYTPQSLDAVIQKEELPFTTEALTLSADHRVKFYFIAYEPAELLIEIHNRTIEDIDYKLKPRTTVIAVSTNDIDNSNRELFATFDNAYKAIDFPKNYNSFHKYVSQSKNIASLEKTIATLPIIQPNNEMLDLRNGVCIEGCEFDDTISTVHFGNYLYRGKLKNGVPHDESGTSILYKLRPIDINKVKNFVGYKSSEKIDGVILSGIAYLQYLKFDVNTGIAITKPYKHLLLDQEVYAQVQIKEDSKIDTSFAFLCTTPDCKEEDKIYGGEINENLEANGIGQFKLIKDNKEFIINTHWKNNLPYRRKINAEGVNGNEKITYVVSNNGKFLENNIVDLRIDTLNNLLLAGMEVTKTQYEESILSNPNAKPIQRLIGGFGFTENKMILFGNHTIRKYNGIGDVNDENSWEVLKSCQLSSFESKNSCFISGDNFYKLDDCSTKNGGFNNNSNQPSDNGEYIFQYFGF